MKKRLTALFIAFCTTVAAAGCALLPGGSSGENEESDFSAGRGESIRILSGSENRSWKRSSQTVRMRPAYT